MSKVQDEKKEGRRTKKFTNIHIFFTWVILLDFMGVVALVAILYSIIRYVFHVNFGVPPIVAIVFISSAIGGTVTFFLGKLVLDPIRELNKAMNKVGSGDFSVRLDTKSRLREVNETYSNFNKMTKELGNIELVQNDFVSNVSHEFKTPIGAIEGYAMLAQESQLSDEEKKEYLDRILFNTHRLSDLVGNILLLSKVENQELSANGKDFSLDEQIRQALLLLEPKWEEKNIDFDVDMEEIKYVGNESMLLHVWSNLIGNAIKFGPSEGLIKIRLYKNDGKIIFLIEDEGDGISDEAKAHIFDKFYQSDSSHKEEGNGLGLSLAKKIVELNGGKIDVCNLDKGCRFTVSLDDKK